MTNSLRNSAGLIALAMLVAGTTAARADMLATTSNTGGGSGGSAQVNVPLFLDGSTVLNFKTTITKQKVGITFNAKCRADGNG